MSRRKIVAGNWKMNMTPTEALALIEELKPLVVNDDVDVVFCVPAIDIVPVVNILVHREGETPNVGGKAEAEAEAAEEVVETAAESAE